MVGHSLADVQEVGQSYYHQNIMCKAPKPKLKFSKKDAINKGKFIGGIGASEDGGLVHSNHIPKYLQGG